MVIASVDFCLAPDHPYPAQVQDTRYGIRWLTAHASEFNASPDSVGETGVASGGHNLILGRCGLTTLGTRPSRHRTSTATTGPWPTRSQARQCWTPTPVISTPRVSRTTT
ncbi:MAG: hypothetical protein CL879_06155 [Dehalococcoidia bacterium]|nr:hypothetical protein [Dehalococcoidia bacterium]